MSDSLTGDDLRTTRLRVVMAQAAEYGTISPLGPFEFLVVQPSTRPNHILHLLLALLTVGFWTPVWLVLGLVGRAEERHVVRVDESGKVWVDNALRTRGLGLR